MAIFGSYTGARIQPLPSGFMGAAMTSAANYQRGFESLGKGIGEALEQYGRNKDERELLEGDIDAIKQIVESNPQRYHDVATNEDNIKKFSEVPDMNLGKLRAYAMNLRTQMGAVDRKVAQDIQELQRQKLLRDEAAVDAYSDALANRPKAVVPVMQEQRGTKTVLPIKQGQSEKFGEFAASRPEEVTEMLQSGVPIVSGDRDSLVPEDFRGMASGFGRAAARPTIEAIKKFAGGAKQQFLNPVAGVGKSLAALTQIPGVPGLTGYFQPKHQTIRGSGFGGGPTPEDIARLDHNRSERERLKAGGLYEQWQIDEMVPPMKVEEAPLYVPRDKGDSPGAMLEQGVNQSTGLPELVHRYAGETSNLRMPEESDVVPTGYWTGLALRGEMPDDPYTVTADGERALYELMDKGDLDGIPSVERFLELNPHLPVWYDKAGKAHPGDGSGTWVPPIGTKILIPNETMGQGIDKNLFWRK